MTAASTAPEKRPDKLHIYEACEFVMVHTTPSYLWWPIFRKMSDLERWGGPDQQQELQQLRKECDRLQEMFKRAQDAITRLRAQTKAKAMKEAKGAGKDIKEFEEEYDDINYQGDEDEKHEELYLHMWCSIPLDNKLPEAALERLITGDLDTESTKLAAKAYYNVEPTVERLQKIQTDNIFELNVLMQVINRIHNGLWEIEISSHKYKVVLNFGLHQGWGVCEVRADIPIRLGDFIFNENRAAGDDLYHTRAGSSLRVTAEEALKHMHLAPTDGKTEEDYKLTEDAKQMASQVGNQIATKGTFVQKNDHWWGGGLTFRAHGTQEKPQKAIIEPKLGLSGDGERERDGSPPNELPFVRVFSLERKQYGFFDVRDIDEYEFDRDLINQLVMPEVKKNVLTSVISAKPGSVMADIVRGKHGGFVILAAGPTGVGKTLTAEAVSEWLERPLYAVEVAELGTAVDKLEAALGEIFVRASRWNAILLFDEADVFLAKRNLDLERSAIVGVFLRMMDYHDGVIFMTTNRADILDPAMFSRLSMLLEYKPLRRKARNMVWNVMLTDAPELQKFSTTLSRLPLNGRQIRNTARIIRALDSQREDTITEKEVMEVTATATRARLTLWRRFVSRLGY